MPISTKISKGDLVILDGSIESDWVNNQWVEHFKNIRDNRICVEVVDVDPSGISIKVPNVDYYMYVRLDKVLVQVVFTGGLR